MTETETTKQQATENGGSEPRYGRGRHPNSRRNLTRGMWQPGESGNLAGRPKGARSRSTLVREYYERSSPTMREIIKEVFGVGDDRR